MKQQDRKRYEARARIAKAMAHPSRLLMLDLMKDREACVGELADAVGADQSTVSKHLSVLKNAGLVDWRKEGTTSYYRVTCGCLDGFFSCLESVLVSDLEIRRTAAQSLD